jgi:hypothetical protein
VIRVELAPWRPPSPGARWGALVAIGLLTWWMASDDDGYLRVVDDANLAFHEAGHMFFGVLGEALGLYGGTLGQLVFPTVAAATFWLVRREPASLALAAAWFGQNLTNIARYAADARTQALPLVGGGEHDWTHILGRWDAISSDQSVAAVFRISGWLIVLAAAAWLAIRWRPSQPQSPSPPQSQSAPPSP